MRLSRLAAVLVAGWMVASPAVAAEPDRGPCTEDEDSPSCGFLYGDVVFVADGDTIDVSVPGGGVRRVRLTGINAMEQTRYSRDARRRRGDCHALAATGRLEGLIARGGGRVRLAAQDARSAAGRRLRRQVSVRIDGSWVDTGGALAAEGLALWLPHPVEYAWNRRYRTLSQQAAARELRLFDADACGAGPSAGAEPELELRWDAPGDDGVNVNGESARIHNPSTRPLPLGGWWFRDSSARRFTFPADAVIPPDGDVTVRVGRGTDDSDDFHWGLPGPAFENASGGPRAMGDGGYLFDARGNLRAWSIYPSADDPQAGWRPPTGVGWIIGFALLVVALVAILRARR